MSDQVDVGPANSPGKLKSFLLNFDVNKLLSLIQAIAIVAGGVWAVREWLQFQKQNESLTLQQQKLAVAVANVTLQSESIGNEISKLKLKQLNEGRYTVDTGLSIVRLRDIGSDANDAVYKVLCKFKITSTSDAEFTVGYTITEVFLADLMHADA